ncbi:site-specific DNA-methyltransferase [Pseudomonas helleri]|uniref:site-specific DNA-methyltransferase (adenine-specific) n=2 Tax=Pseudomonas helleri TaxID=1608996 RepID=A0A7X2CD47_9PSED|nr:site-specific DNA-methyltransferase [Pseudomonas helleri]
MQIIDAQSPEAHSADLKAENIAKLKALFPELLSEGPNGVAINQDVLKQLVGDATATDADEKYGLNWHGKRAARQLALTPSIGTLLPCPDESEDWDSTRNLMIEGDNLEVLKLLQKSYAGKVKLIYIDPPYNTGKDFVYPDNFQDNIKNYLELTGQLEGGAKISSNADTSGRFHTDWLNMIYPRLKLARNLLKDDGIIFISIDSTEVANLRTTCDEVFGGECFVIDLIWKKRDGAPNDRTIGSVHEHILVYGKSLSSNSGRTLAEENLNLMPRTEKADAEYQIFREPNGPDKRGRFRKIDTTANAKGGRDVASLHYGIINPYTDVAVYPRSGTCWRHSEAEMKKLEEDGRLYWGVNGTATTPMRKLFLSEAKNGMSTPSILTDMPLNQHAARELEVLFGQKSVFDTPKPVDLLKLIVGIGSNENDLILDFFAGSGSTAESVMLRNLEDGGSRRFIVAQLPEPINLDNKDQKIPYEYCKSIGKASNIAELTKERLRRSGARIKADNPMFSGDTGFRVFKLDTSNIRAWNPSPTNLAADLLAHEDHLIEGRSESDILYELLLKLGLDLCVPIEQQQIASKTVHSVGGGVLLACLAEHITRDQVEDLAQGIITWQKAQPPAGDSTCVFRDSAFADDIAKTNLAAILNQAGIKNVRSL